MRIRYLVPGVALFLFLVFTVRTHGVFSASLLENDNDPVKDDSGYGPYQDALPRVEKKGGKWCFVHAVAQGQTLYSLSFRYKVESEEIENLNPEVKDGLLAGSVIYIPVSDDFIEYHEVASGETLFAIAQDYDVSVEGIKGWNVMFTDEVKEGQYLQVIRFDPSRAGVVPIQPDPVAVGEDEHLVEPGETLYSIAGNYDVSVEDLIRWNKLEGNGISNGQVIKIDGEPKAEPPGADVTQNVPARQLQDPPPSNPPTPDLGQQRERNEKSRRPAVRNPAGRSGESEATGQGKEVKQSERAITPPEREGESVLADDPTKDQDVPEESASSPAIKLPEVYFDKRIETGMAELIEGDRASDKFLALHREAPVGAILSIENELNRQIVFVRVIGSIPQTGANEKVVVKISKSAWENLGAVNKKLRVKVTYVQ